MEITTCTLREIPALAATAKAIWNEYFIDLITQAQIDYMVEQFQSEPALTKAITEEGYTYFLGKQNGEIVGYCGVRVDDDRLFLSKFYMKKELRGKGLSSSLLKQAINYAKEQRCHAIYLTCNKYNEHSLNVYKHKGFQVMDAVQTEIGEGFIMDDYILELNL